MWFRKDDPGKVLRMLMAKHDINTAELADLTGLSKNTISRLRTGQVTRPTTETARRVAEAFGVQIDKIWRNLNY